MRVDRKSSAEIQSVIDWLFAAKSFHGSEVGAVTNAHNRRSRNYGTDKPDFSP
jgi:hypothetical protein